MGEREAPWSGLATKRNPFWGKGIPSYRGKTFVMVIIELAGELLNQLLCRYYQIGPKLLALLSHLPLPWPLTPWPAVTRWDSVRLAAPISTGVARIHTLSQPKPNPTEHLEDTTTVGKKANTIRIAHPEQVQLQVPARRTDRHE